LVRYGVENAIEEEFDFPESYPRSED